MQLMRLHVVAGIFVFTMIIYMHSILDSLTHNGLGYAAGFAYACHLFFLSWALDKHPSAMKGLTLQQNIVACISLHRPAVCL